MNNQISLCKIYLDNFAIKSSNFYYHSCIHIKNDISKFFDVEIENKAFMAAAVPMFEHRHMIDEHYLFKLRLIPPNPKIICIGDEMYNQYAASLFERNGIFYKPSHKNGILAFEQILANNKNQQKTWD